MTKGKIVLVPFPDDDLFSRSQTPFGNAFHNAPR